MVPSQSQTFPGVLTGLWRSGDKTISADVRSRKFPYHDAVRLVHEQKTAFDRPAREEALEDRAVSDHLGPVAVGEVADATRLEVDQGDAVGGDDEPIDDAERAGVGDVLFGEDPAWPKKDLAHLSVAEEPLDSGPLLFGEAARLDPAFIAGEAGEGRVDADPPLDPRLDIGGAERRVNLLGLCRRGGPSASSGAANSSWSAVRGVSGP
ncbi:MAG TPA: hypothetical protein P5244_09195 [Syntrophales bacterium]|nr:hypothetical protein [Syntrophales bacterium]